MIKMLAMLTNDPLNEDHNILLDFGGDRLYSLGSIEKVTREEPELNGKIKKYVNFVFKIDKKTLDIAAGIQNDLNNQWNRSY